MKITVDGQVYEYDPARLLNTEAIALQKVTGMRIQEWTQAMQEGDAYALTGLIWLLWRRDGQDVPFDAVEFDMGALEVQSDEDPEPEVPTAPAEPAPDSAA